MTVNSAALLNLSTGMTVQAWVFPIALDSWRTVILKERPGGLSYALYANNDIARPSAHLNFGGGASIGTNGTVQLPLNTWTHLAATYDEVTLRMYVNGANVGSRAVSGSVVTSSSPLRIGGNSIWGEYFAGRIDEVRIHNRALTQTEIQALMTTPVEDPQGFEIIVYNNPVTVGLSDSGTYNLGIAPIGDFTGRTYPSLSGLPADTAGVFEPFNGPPHPGPFALKIDTGATTPAGTYTLAVTVTNGPLSATTNLTLIVTDEPGFRVNVEPNGLIVAQGQIGIAAFEVVAQNGYSQSVNLSATGMPAGTSVNFTPTVLTPTGSGSVQFNVGLSTPPGVYQVSLMAVDGTLTASAPFTLTVQEKNDSGSWRQLSLGDSGAVYYGVTVGDVGSIGKNRVYGSAGSGEMYEYIHDGTSWSYSKMPVGEPADGQMHNMDIGPARRDGSNRLYIAAVSTGRIYEMSWVNGAWQSNTVAVLEGATDMVVGDGRNDGVTRLYVSWKSGATELTWEDGGWTQLTLSSNEGGWVHGIDLNIGRNDGNNRIYTANEANGEVYEYTWTGTNWSKLFMGDTFDARNLEVGEGRNDGTNRVYVASADGNVYEFTWNGSTWQSISTGNAGSPDIKVQSKPARVRSDGLVRVYVAAGSGVYEYSWTNTTWQTAHLGNAVAYMYGLALGDGLNNGTTQVYASSYDGNVYLFEWVPTFNTTNISVPNVVGMTEFEATSAIENAGLILGAVTIASSDTVSAGSVISQNPVGGVQIAPGSAVNLVVSSGPATSPVITSVEIIGGEMVFSGTNGSGVGGGTFYLCSSTNVAAPLSEWSRESTNIYGSGGAFFLTNVVNQAVPRKFYLLEEP